MNKQGITLIELLITVALISIVSTTAFFVLRPATENQKDTVRLLNAKNIQVALEGYYNAHGQYPSFPVNSTAIAGEGKNCRTLKSVYHLLQPYLRTLPVDPDADANNDSDPMHYKYSVNNNKNPQQYVLAVNVNKNNYDQDNDVLKQTLYASEITKISTEMCKCTQQGSSFDVRVASNTYKRLCVGSIEKTTTQAPTSAQHFPKNYTQPSSLPLLPTAPVNPAQQPSSPSTPSPTLTVTSAQAVTHSTDQDKLVVSWNTVATATGYELRYKPSTTNIYETFSGTATPTGTTLENLQPGTLYDIQIRATNGGWSTISGTTSGTAPTSPQSPQSLAQVTGLSLTVESSTQIRAVWNNIPGIQSYQTQFCTGDNTACPESGVWTVATSAPVRQGSDKITHPLNNLTPGTTYKIRVRAQAGSSFGRYSAVQTATTRLNKVTGVTASAGSTPNELSVAWTAITDATSYVVEYRYRYSAVQTWSSHQPEPTTNSATITGLFAATQYSVRIQAKTSVTTGEPSDIVNGRTSSPPSPTITVVAGSTNTELDVSWTAVPGATQYTACYREVRGYGCSAPVSPPQTSSTIRGLAPNTTYNIFVRTRIPAPGTYSTLTSPNYPATTSP